MKIKNLFTKDLNRTIKGVVQVDETDNQIVWQELEEYVVTRELRRHYDKFFSTYLSAIDNSRDPAKTNRIGVWISGFFGSGKSHFIKMMAYLLRDQAVKNPDNSATKKPVDFFTENIDDAMFSGDVLRAVRTQADVISFNIDAKADSQRGDNTLLEVFWRVFNEMQGFSKDDLITADLERFLTKEKAFEKFKEVFREIDGNDWEEERDARYFKQDAIVKSLSIALGISEDSATKYFDNADNTLNVTVENFVQRVKEYLETQPLQKRLVFIVDEVGQFIGQNVQLMLKLQTLVEELGSNCQGRVWVIVTSQEDVEAVLGELNRGQKEDFSKILGRFPTHLKLSSINIDEVIQERLLKKTTEAQAELKQIYDEKSEILRHQIIFSGGTSLSSFRTEEDFVKSYPFLPYQFTLVQKIFESIRKYGATGAHLSQGERSMLNAFQNAANAVAEKELGTLVPLYEFFPTIEGFLESAVSRAINQSTENPKLQEFDGKVLRVLFLLRYVETFKTNLENLVTLFVDQIDADRLKIRSMLDESLIRLENESLINRTGEEYFFLTDEEQRVSKEIRDIPLSESEETKKMSELIFDGILSGVAKFRFPANRKDYDFNLILDDTPYKRLLDENLNLKIITPLNQNFEKFNDAVGIGLSAESGGCVLIKLAKPHETQKGKGFASELRLFLQTDKFYNTRHTIDAPENLKRILSARKEENNSREKRLSEFFNEMLKDAEIYVLGQKLDNNAPTAKQSVNNAQDYLVKNAFSKLDYLIVENRDWEKEIKMVLLADDVVQNALIEIEKDYSSALREIREYIKLQTGMNRRIGLDDLVSHFENRPFGWLNYSISWLIAKIFVSGEINLVADSNDLDAKDAVEFLTKQRRWNSVTIRQKRLADADTISKVSKLGHEIFGEMPSDKDGELEKFWRGKLTALQNELQGDLRLASTDRYVGKDEIADSLKQIEGFLAYRDSFDFLNNLREKADDLRDLKEDTEELRQFYTNQIGIWQKLQNSLADFKTNHNFLERDAMAAQALRRLEEISNAKRPYAMLRDVEENIAKVNELNEKLLDDERQIALVEIENQREKIKAGLDEIKADGDLRSKFLHPFHLLLERVKVTRSITTIRYAKAEELRELVERLEFDLENEKAKLMPDNTPPPKPVFNVKPSQLSAKSYLETETDVDEFLGKLRETMLKAITEEKRVKVI